MKKALLIGASLVVSLGTAAQTLNVVVGEVTYKIPASQAGSMDYADGSRLTILGKIFQLKEVTRMYVDHSDVADNSVSVTYNGSAAAVTVAGNCMSHLDVTVNGSAVSIVQDETVDTELCRRIQTHDPGQNLPTEGSDPHVCGPFGRGRQ